MHDHSNMLSHDIAVSQAIQMHYQLDVQQANAALQQDQAGHHETPAGAGKLWAILAVIVELLGAR
jgi:hypothetical protein